MIFANFASGVSTESLVITVAEFPASIEKGTEMKQFFFFTLLNFSNLSKKQRSQPAVPFCVPTSFTKKGFLSYKTFLKVPFVIAQVEEGEKSAIGTASGKQKEIAE
ncbi:hypothetical protein TNIN_246221 [Trichonephila inaurata madagascariensis]|uniref:Uncharacterized protein n=1 Tax=Trichonephila inaurata madagascariensis TaxID=2747483 RepID=A0A8X6XMZ7_9ARAC|nr:hypothetical protein TNIN_246221 [Trichonephila inaurata madagascariensis]